MRMTMRKVNFVKKDEEEEHTLDDGEDKLG
jgi:hypothetical protein